MLTTRKRRRFQHTKSGSVQTLCLLVGLITLAACAERSDNWSPIESPKKNQVSWAEFHHPVKFTKSSAVINQTEKDTLSRFLSRVGRGEGVTVTLNTGSDQRSSLMKQRETSLARVFQGYGIAVSRVRTKQSSPGSSDTVRVTVGRYIVKPPSCADWSKPATGDTNNQQSSNYGCATETNLGAMIADPGVLVRGKDIGPGDGEAATLGIGKYRKGAVTKPAAISTQER